MRYFIAVLSFGLCLNAFARVEVTCHVDAERYLKCDKPFTVVVQVEDEQEPSSSSSSSSSTSTSSSASSTSSTSSSTSSTSSSSSSSGIAYDHVVSSADELAAVMAKAVGGEVVLLRDGHYGDLVVGKQYADYVELLAENTQKASLGAVTLKGASRGYVRFNGLTVNNYDIQTGAHHAEILNNLVRSNIYMKNASDVLVRNTTIQTDLTDGLHSSRLNSVKRVAFEHNWLSGAREDLMAITGDSEDVRIVKNVFYNTRPQQTIGPVPRMVNGVERKCQYNHSDAIQFFGADGVSPRKILVEGNLFFDDPSDNEIRVDCGDGRITMQGVFVSDPNSDGYEDVTIRNNVFYVGSSNTIFINGAKSNVLVENNTLIGWGNGGGTIRVVDQSGKSNAGLTLRNNLARSIADTSNTFELVPGLNHVYKGDDAPLIFMMQGMAGSWHSFLPRDEALNGVGASAELLRIQAGEASAPGPLVQ